MTDNTGSNKDVRHISAKCHCGAFKVEQNLPAAWLPMEDTLCHCWSCRHRTGSMAVLPVPLPDYAPTPDDLAPLAVYETHRGNKPVRSYFCKTCGSSVFFSITGSDGVTHWNLSLGLVDDPRGLFKIAGHSFLNDTKDGGISVVLPELDMQPTCGDSGWGESTSARTPSPYKSSPPEHLPLTCSCAAFSVLVSRPNPDLPLPKNCYWYRPPTSPEGKPTRFMATWCGCDSCRTTSGNMLPALAMVQIPLADLHVARKGAEGDIELVSFADHVHGGETKSGDVLTISTDIPGLTRYNSSDGIARYHCATCGAHILYYDPSRPFLGTFHAGLVDADDGARAESWLSWWTGQDGHPVGAVHCPDEAKARDEAAATAWADGLVSWGKRTGKRT